MSDRNMLYQVEMTALLDGESATLGGCTCESREDAEASFFEWVDEFLHANMREWFRAEPLPWRLNVTRSSLQWQIAFWSSTDSRDITFPSRQEASG